MFASIAILFQSFCFVDGRLRQEKDAGGIARRVHHKRTSHKKKNRKKALEEEDKALDEAAAHAAIDETISIAIFKKSVSSGCPKSL